MKATPKVPQYAPGELPPTDSDLIHAGKRPSELTLEEARACAVRFRDAQVEAVLSLAAAQRRMKKLEEVVPKAMVAKLDRWLKVHPQDAWRGDGGELYTNWQKWDG